MLDTLTLWWEGVRARTLPAAIAPVAVGFSAARHIGAESLRLTLLALAVALFLQVGVNFANDYSDGVRGTDDDRVGPTRLTGSGAVAPSFVLLAAWLSFALAGLAGLILVAATKTWWLLGVGAAAIVAAWFYTGGKNPYGYMGVGLSELLVFVFFGPVAVVGTMYTQTHQAPWWVWVLGVGCGAISVCLLMVNNIRDRATDEVSGKRTIVVRMGERNAKLLFSVFAALPVGCLYVALGNTKFVLFVAMSALALAVQLWQIKDTFGYLSLLRLTGAYSVVYAVVCFVELNGSSSWGM